MRTGTVDRATSKDVKTRFGMKKTYSLQIDGVWYSCGFNDPRCSVGEEVAFESTSGPYGEEITKGTLMRTGAKSTAVAVPTPVASADRPAAPKSAVGGGATNRPFPVPALHGDRAIIRQNSLGHAVKMLECNMPSDASNEDIAERVIDLARKFEAYSCGDLDAAMAADMINKAKTKVAKAAVDAELGE